MTHNFKDLFSIKVLKQADRHCGDYWIAYHVCMETEKIK